MSTTHITTSRAAVSRLFSTGVLPEQMLIEVCQKMVGKFTVPATTGQMGALSGHMTRLTTMTALNPGLLSLQEADKTTKYFSSGGFALIHPSSITDIIKVLEKPRDQLLVTLRKLQPGSCKYS